MHRNQWWKTATIYQIYPKSFNDSNGDGIGDLRGIIEKIPYFKNLGVDALWLTPIYVSPQNDGGYDISDYFTIDSVYGTLEDFKTLVHKLHQEGIKIIMDIVVNHTSVDHYFFQQARLSKDNPYRDYYIWKKSENGNPPNNWESKFGGSAWEYDDLTDEYYLHLYDVTQADLNWENPKVKEEVVKIMEFWANLGIDGFRLDVINVISKDQTFPNDDKGDGRRFYTDGPKIHEYLKFLNSNIFSKFNMLTVGEMSSTSLDQCVKYTNPDEKELDMVFNFHHLKVDYKNGDKWALQDIDFKELKHLFTTWQQGMYEGNGWMALFLNNHDQPRSVSRYGSVENEDFRILSAKMLALMMFGMQGTTYIYQGEEIGMPSPHWDSIEEFKDIESLNYYKIFLEKGLSQQEALNIIIKRSRDNSRVPISWNDEKNGGFSEGTPWLKVLPNYSNINVEKDLKSSRSVFYFYKNLISLRKTEPIITQGSFKELESSDNIYAYIRELENKKLLIVCNFSKQEQDISFNNDLGNINKISKLISNYEDKDEDYILLGNGTYKLKPYESFIVKID